MDFGQALGVIKNGNRAARDGWNGKGMWVQLHTPDDPDFHRPYICMSCVDGQLVPWVASQTDLLADDWGVVDG